MSRNQPGGGDFVSVLVLAQDEASTIEDVLIRVSRQLHRNGFRHELIVVDGGSRDDTVALASRAGARVVAQHGEGYGNALREGLSCCRGDVVVTLDAISRTIRPWSSTCWPPATRRIW
jgi:glycosyltransferase involved in cell wall biosynthesis